MPTSKGIDQISKPTTPYNFSTTLERYSFDSLKRNMTGLLETPTRKIKVQRALTKQQTPRMDLSSSSAMHDETTSTSSSEMICKPVTTTPPPCDACPHCADVCDNTDCVSCKEKSVLYCLPISSKKDVSAAAGENNKTLHTTTFFTLCQVKRHNHKESAWIMANNAVYDVTSYLSRHPAGAACILSVAGGQQDCTQGYRKHKYFARQKFDKFLIGKLKKCDGAKRGRRITVFLQRALCSSSVTNKE